MEAKTLNWILGVLAAVLLGFGILMTVLYMKEKKKNEDIKKKNGGQPTEKSRVTNADGTITVTFSDGTTKVLPKPVV